MNALFYHTLAISHAVLRAPVGLGTEDVPDTWPHPHRDKLRCAGRVSILARLADGRNDGDRDCHRGFRRTLLVADRDGTFGSVKTSHLVYRCAARLVRSSAESGGHRPVAYYTNKPLLLSKSSKENL